VKGGLCPHPIIMQNPECGMSGGNTACCILKASSQKRTRLFVYWKLNKNNAWINIHTQWMKVKNRVKRNGRGCRFAARTIFSVQRSVFSVEVLPRIFIARLRLATSTLAQPKLHYAVTSLHRNFTCASRKLHSARSAAVPHSALKKAVHRTAFFALFLLLLRIKLAHG